DVDADANRGSRCGACRSRTGRRRLVAPVVAAPFGLPRRLGWWHCGLVGLHGPRRRVVRSGPSPGRRRGDGAAGWGTAFGSDEAGEVAGTVHTGAACWVRVTKRPRISSASAW